MYCAVLRMDPWSSRKREGIGGTSRQMEVDEIPELDRLAFMALSVWDQVSRKDPEPKRARAVVKSGPLLRVSADADERVVLFTTAASCRRVIEELLG